MKRALLLAGLLLCIGLQAAAAPGNAQVAQQMNKMPLSFTKNMGQWDDHVLFRANAGGATMWLTKEGVTYQFTRRIDTRGDAVSVPGVGQNRFGFDASGLGAGAPPLAVGFDPLDRLTHDKDSIETLVLTAKFDGANPNPEVIAEGQMEYKCNYFFGNDPSKWHTDVPNYEAITLKNIYPGIDLKYSGDGSGQVAYEFIVAPGADIAQIKVQYEGAEETSIDADGRVILATKWGDVIATIKSPTNGVLSGTACLSLLSKTVLGFEPDGSNGQALGTLAVGLDYSTYLGGGGTDETYAIAVDSSGNAYVTGYTASSDFPTLNPYQTDQFNWDAFVTKLSASGNTPIYSTYLGAGTGIYSNDQGYSIAVDGSGNAYVMGFTQSPNFPILNALQATFQGGDQDAFVTKLSNTGNSLIYSTYLGGEATEWGHGIAVDSSGNAYVTGFTNSSNFPTFNAYQASFQGVWDAFVTKLSSSGNSLIYSTYLGGGNSDAAYGIAVDDSGNAYVTGGTYSYNFPTLNPYQWWPGDGNANVFVTKLNSAGSSPIYSTYLGGQGYDQGAGIAVDGVGNAYVTGSTASANFPTMNPLQSTFGGDRDVFVTKLSSSGNALVYSTYLGGGAWDQGNSIAIDGSGSAHITGYTYTSSNFPTKNPFQATYQGGNTDAFVTKLSTTGSGLIYSTYLGGWMGDAAFGIAVDGSGKAYVTGFTNSSNFPTQNPFQPTYHSNPNYWNDAFVTKFSGCPSDADCDGMFDGLDNCQSEPNPDQQDFDGDGIGDACDNCPFSSNPSQEDSNYDGFGDLCSYAAATPAGYGVIVQLDSNVALNFGTVFDSGSTSMAVTAGGPPASSAFTIVPSNLPMYFNLSTTAIYSGLIEVCIHYDSTWYAPAPEVSLSLRHYFDPIWIDITSSRDTIANLICGITNSLSPFVLTVSTVICGDADGEGTINIADAVFLVNYIFADGPAPSPLASGDADCDEAINIADVVYLVNYIFAGGPEPCAGCK